MEKMGFDTEIHELLNNTYHMGLMVDSPYSPDQLKMKIVATNLKALAKTFMAAADDSGKVQVNFLQVALGILGSCDFLEEGLPDLDTDLII